MDPAIEAIAPRILHSLLKLDARQLRGEDLHLTDDDYDMVSYLVEDDPWLLGLRVHRTNAPVSFISTSAVFGPVTEPLPSTPVGHA